MKFGLMRNHLRLAAVVVIGAIQVGCPAPPVGDPCTPEQIPTGGFDKNEAYVETSSVQCETRVCLVYKLSGDPRCTTGELACDPSVMQPTQELIDQHIYCTCRCKSSNDAFATCECPDGFSCQPVLELGGPGVQGSYCVRNGT